MWPRQLLLHHQRRPGRNCLGDGVGVGDVLERSGYPDHDSRLCGVHDSEQHAGDEDRGRRSPTGWDARRRVRRVGARIRRSGWRAPGPAAPTRPFPLAACCRSPTRMARSSGRRRAFRSRRSKPLCGSRPRRGNTSAGAAWTLPAATPCSARSIRRPTCSPGATAAPASSRRTSARFRQGSIPTGSIGRRCRRQRTSSATTSTASFACSTACPRCRRCTSISHTMAAPL